MGTTQSHFYNNVSYNCNAASSIIFNNGMRTHMEAATMEDAAVEKTAAQLAAEKSLAIQKEIEMEAAMGAAMPKMDRIETFDEKFIRKFKEEPLIPIGCAATTYALLSGLVGFKNQDVERQKKMMRMRVACQFFTIVSFACYLGWDRCDFRLAPMVQDMRKAQREAELEAQREAAAAGGGGGNQ